jgi:hypothetical protein
MKTTALLFGLGLTVLSLPGCMLAEAFTPPESWEVKTAMDRQEQIAAAHDAHPPQPAPVPANEYTPERIAEINKALAQRWRSMTPQQRAALNRQELELQEYHNRLDRFNEANGLSRICGAYGCQ